MNVLFRSRPGALTPSRTLVARAVAAAAGPALAGLLVVACGGGGGAAPTSTSAQGMSTWADGPVQGFGSVIVNGVRFDDSSATVSDDDGRQLSSAQIALGMEVEVSAGDEQSGRAMAHGFFVHSAAVGPVEAVDAAAGTLTVIGQSVTVDASTAIDPAISGGLAGLQVGTVVRVYGADDGQGGIHATRLELAGTVQSYKIVGAVTAWDATTATLQIGGATIDVSGIASLPEGLAVGTRVRAVLQTTPAAGVWVATALTAEDHHFQGDHDQAHLNGAITAFTSATSFSVDGTPVDASQAQFPDGQSGLALGAVVEVEGTMSNGTLVASRVSLESEHQGLGHDIELHGAISGLDTTAMTFMLRGSLVSYAGTVQFLHGTVASLADNVSVEVQGDLGPDGHTVVATTIDFAAP